MFLKQPLRQEDVNEWVFLSGMRIADIFKATQGELGYSRAFLDDAGVPQCLWGLRDNLGWLIATQRASVCHGKAIQRHWRSEFIQMARKLDGGPLYAMRLNETDAGREWHLRLGFTVYSEGWTHAGHLTLYERKFQWE